MTPDPRQVKYLVKYQLLDVVTMSAAEYSDLTGQTLAGLPEVTTPPASPNVSDESPSSDSNAVGLGTGSLFVPEVNWYYRVLSKNDPNIEAILGDAGLKPIEPLKIPGDPAELTFRHLRPGGNVLSTGGTNRISAAAHLDSFNTILRERGTGELVSIDVVEARRLGAEFLEHDTIMQHLAEVQQRNQAELARARAAGRGRNHLSRIEGRLQALEIARERARTFREGQGVEGVPSGAIRPVQGSTMARAVAREQLFRGGLKFVRFGGRVMLIVGIAISFDDIASAPPDEKVRVAMREAGGWAFSFAGGAAGAKVGAAIGGALGFETGPGAIILAALGGLVGGVIGFVAGKDGAQKAHDEVEKMGKLMKDPATSNRTMIIMFGSDDAKRAYREMEEIETGEPAWEVGF